MEMRAYKAYKNPDIPIYFWRTSAGQEVDFIMGDKELAVEIKASARVHEGDMRSLTALKEDGRVKNAVIVSLEKEPRSLANGIEILPWRTFIEKLWAGEYC